VSREKRDGEQGDAAACDERERGPARDETLAGAHGAILPAEREAGVRRALASGIPPAAGRVTFAEAVRCGAMKLLIRILAALALVTPAATPAGATSLAPLHGSTAVHTFGGVQVFSDRDPATKRWHVVVRRDGQLAVPSIPTATKPIEVDVGPGADGGAVLAYVGCATACRVVVSRLDGSAPRTVPGSAGASQPTIWRDQVAWVRGGAAVMTSTPDGRGRRALAGAPRRKCYRLFAGAGRRCAPPQSANVDALELQGSQLALVDTFRLGKSAESVAEVRTESIEGGAQRLVALMDTGEGGQTWIGPSWAKGRLFFYKSCFDDASACNGAAGGAFAFDPAHNAYSHAPSSTVLEGFAIDDDGQRAYEALSPRPSACGDVGAGPCELRLTGPLAFKPSRSQVREP